MAEVRILSIDGGGIRGILPLMVLAEIEKRLGRPVLEQFHLTAGSSTGGLIALGLARTEDGKPIKSAQELLDLYVTRGPEIFSRSLMRSAATMNGFLGSKYNGEGLNRVLRDTFGDTTLAQIRDDVMVTAYNMEERSPHYFKTWQARGEPIGNGFPTDDPRAKNFPVVDAARATAAAPTYFPAHLARNELGQTFPLIDGAVFAGNPTMRAVSNVRHKYHKSHDMFVLSLGTGEQVRPISYDTSASMGKIGWASRIFNVTSDGQSQSTNYDLEAELGDNFIRIDTDLRCDVPGLDKPSEDLDDASPENIEALLSRGRRMIAENSAAIDRIVEKFRNEAPAAKADLAKPVPVDYTLSFNGHSYPIPHARPATRVIEFPALAA